MAASPHLSRKIRDTLGQEAGEEMIGILDKVSSDISDLRGDVAELRHQTHMGFARLEKVIADRMSGLIKWSFAFWVGAVLSIAALARALR